MKLILSRKGFDSASGGQPSPIMPDGTLLSLPIPSEDRGNSFSTLYYKGMSYLNIIDQLKTKNKFHGNEQCHLDPDLRQELRDREEGWRASFGQMEAPLTHLRNQGVGVGDLFVIGKFAPTKNGKVESTKNGKIQPSIHLHART
jgi:hypothetical protein